jgi:hypothetical protein
MKFVYIEQAEDSEFTEQQIHDAVAAALAPLGYKVRAMMDRPQVVAFINGMNQIIDKSLISTVQEIVDRYDEDEPIPEDFNPYDAFGGNMDDAFNSGVQRGREQLAQEIREAIQ